MAQILIADDDEVVAEYAANILMDDGHACGWVTDGQKLMQVISWKRPDLILLDQEMPKMTGYQVLRALRTSENFYDIPVIMFTAKTGVQDEEQAMYAGAQDYIRKPVGRQTLLWHVNKTLRDRYDRPKHVELETFLKENSGLWFQSDEEDNHTVRRVV